MKGRRMENSGVSGRPSAPGSGSKVPQRKVQCSDDAVDKEEVKDEDDDDGFSDEKTEAKAPMKKSIQDTPAKNAQKPNQNGKESKPSIPR